VESLVRTEAVTIEDLYKRNGEQFPFWVESMYKKSLHIKIIDQYQGYWFAEAYGKLVTLQGNLGEWLPVKEGET